MYHLDRSKDVDLLNAFKGNDVFFMLFSLRVAVTRHQRVSVTSSGDHLARIELCLKMDFWA